jgi:protein TonB
MFETTAVISKKRRWRGMFWGMLPTSIAAHLLIGVGIVAVQTWDVVFPSAPPARVEAYQYLVALAVPPPPPPPPPPAAAPVQRTETLQKLPDNVAPNAIPEEIPLVEPKPSSPSDGIDTGVEGGVEGGEIGGVVGGTAGGVMPPGPPPPPPDTIVIGRDEKLPLRPLSMTYPIYPDKWRYRSVEDSLVLRYHIDKKGRVIEVIILTPPRFKEFAEVTVAAVRSWRFRPLTVNGEPKEVLHELTVNFKIEKPEQRQPRAPSKPAEAPPPVPAEKPATDGSKQP